MTPKLPERKRRRGQRDMSAPIQEWRFEVGADNHGHRLDSFLSGRLDWRSRNGIKEIINDGYVEVLPFKDPQRAQIAKMKVGFKSYFSDLFYNIQLDVSKSGIAENGYQKVQLMLENS